MKAILLAIIVCLLPISVIASPPDGVGSSGGNLMMLDEKQKVFVSIGTPPKGSIHYMTLWQYDAKEKQLKLLGEVINCVSEESDCSSDGKWENK